MKRKTIHKYCLTLRSIIVRSVGHCELAGLDGRECGGVLQDNHILSRGTRSDLTFHPLNYVCGCQSHHTWYSYGGKDDWPYVVMTHFPMRSEVFGIPKSDEKKNMSEIAERYENQLRLLAESGHLKHEYRSALDRKLIELVTAGKGYRDIFGVKK